MNQSFQPLVSVLMTAWNREKYIGDAIESVLASTYTNFELIIVDDASTDNTINIAKKYAAGDERIKLFVNKQNLGDYPNRNKAASFASGKYLKYVDSDDYIYPNGLEVMVRSMEEFPEAGFGLCSLKPYSVNPFPFVLQPRAAYEYHFFGPGLFHKGPLTSIFLKKAFEAISGFKPGRMISDTDMWYRMSLTYPVVLMPDGIVWQRIHENQELSDLDEYIVQEARIKWEYLLGPVCPLDRQQVKLIRKRRLKRYTSFIFSGIRHFNMRQIKTYSQCLLYDAKIKLE